VSFSKLRAAIITAKLKNEDILLSPKIINVEKSNRKEVKPPSSVMIK
jgi:hypothetical protein